MIEVLSKEKMAVLPEADLKTRVVAANAYVLGLAKGYDYTDLQCACVRSSASGEMGNMFVVCGDYGITAAIWRKTLDNLKAVSSEKYNHYYQSVKACWIIESELWRRNSIKRTAKKVCSQCNGTGLVEDYTDSAGYGCAPSFYTCECQGDAGVKGG